MVYSNIWKAIASIEPRAQRLPGVALTQQMLKAMSECDTMRICSIPIYMWASSNALLNIVWHGFISV